MKYDLALALTGLLASAGDARAQEPTFVDTAIVFLSPTHGVGTFSWEFRDRISTDTAKMRVYAQLLRGEMETSEIWFPAVAVWWLAESGNPEYLPIFLEFARPDASHDEFQMATYGLARLSSVPAARERLLQLAESSSGSHYSALATVLLYVNDDSAREILQQPAPANLHGELERLTREVTRTRPRRRGDGRFPCPFGEVFVADTDGVFRCTKRD